MATFNNGHRVIAPWGLDEIEGTVVDSFGPLRTLVDAKRDEIKAIVSRHGGRSVAIFGSVARGEERADSDIDFLVELDPEPGPP